MVKVMYWSSIRTRPPVVINEFLGANKLDTYSMKNGFASDLKNMSSGKFPALSTRPGFSIQGVAIGTRVLGMGVWKDTELHAVFNDGTWRKWTGSAWSSALASGLDTSAEWSFCNFKGNLSDFNLIGSNGINPAKRYDGTAVQDLTDAPAGINYIDEHDSRLYGVVNGTEVWFSELNVPTNWTVIADNDSDPGAIKKEINTGKRMVGLRAGSGHVTVFFPTSCFELYGTSPSDFRFIEVASDIGMINNKCAVNLNGRMYFAGSRSGYVYGGGSRPDNSFTAPVQWFWDTANATGRSTSCAGTDGRKLYLALAMSSTSAPDTILEFDPLYGVWNVWKDIQPVCFARMGDAMYIGDASGRVLLVGGTTDNGAAITWYWISKPFSAPSMGQVIRWLRAWVTANVPSGSTLNVYLTKEPEEDTGWTLVKTISADAVIESTSIYIDTSTVANARFIRLKLEGTGQVEIREIAREQDTLPLL